jgi:hypothetical protein
MGVAAEKAGAKDSKPAVKILKKLRGIGPLLGALAAALALVVGLPKLFHHPHYSSPLLVEEEMVGQLVAGMDYARLRHVIGVAADYSAKLSSGNELYQYERNWESLQLLVSQSGRVLSVGIYAKTTNFQPKVRFATAGDTLTLNEPVNALAFIGPYGMNAYCGAHKAGYFLAYPLQPAALGASGFVIGASDAEAPMNIYPACSMERLFPRCRLPPPSSLYSNNMSASYASCVFSSSIGRRAFAKIVPSVIIVTTPQQGITSDMLYPPDEVPDLLG